MITLIDIRFARGYSSTDHLLNDGPLEMLIGEQFRSVRDLSRKANKIQRDTDNGYGPIRARIEVRGEIVEVSLWRCKHAKTRCGNERCYSGPVSRDNQNPAAHGNITLTETCLACGMQRECNINQCHEENGDWYRPEDMES